MHIKAVPAAVESILSNKAVLIAGAAALAVGGYWYYTNHIAPAPAAAPAASNGQSLQNPFTQVPTSIGGIGPSTASGADTLASVTGVSSSDTSAVTGGGSGGSTSVPAGTDASSAAVVPAVSYPGLSPSPSTGNTGPFPSVNGIDPATAELLAQQRLSLDYNYQEYMANLNLQANIAAANAYLTNAAIQSNNYTAAVGLAQSFLFSPDQAALGAIIGPDGSQLINFAFIQAQNSNKNGFDANLTTLVNNGTFSNFIAQTQAQPQVTPVSSTAPTSLPMFVLPSSISSGSPTYITAANVNNPGATTPTNPAPSGSITLTDYGRPTLAPSYTVAGNNPPPVQVQSIATPTLNPINTNTMSSGYVGGGGGGGGFRENLQFA